MKNINVKTNDEEARQVITMLLSEKPFGDEPVKLHYIGRRRTVDKSSNFIKGNLKCDNLVIYEVKRRCPLLGSNYPCNMGEVYEVSPVTGTF